MEDLSKEKLKALQATLERLDKSYGKGSVMRMGDEPVEKIEVIKTGSVTLNRALGVGGIPKGRVVEIYGPESSGKTTLANSLSKLLKESFVANNIPISTASPWFIFLEKLFEDSIPCANV